MRAAACSGVPPLASFKVRSALACPDCPTCPTSAHFPCFPFKPGKRPEKTSSGLHVLGEGRDKMLSLLRGRIHLPIGHACPHAALKRETIVKEDSGALWDSYHHVDSVLVRACFFLCLARVARQLLTTMEPHGCGLQRSERPAEMQPRPP